MYKYLGITENQLGIETLWRIYSGKLSAKRRLACEVRCRRAGMAPDRAFTYFWIGDFHKGVREREKQGQSAILSPEEYEDIRLFSQEELDLVWCMRFDLGISQNDFDRDTPSSKSRRW
jgi:hypothetical protein